jgi:predicted metalloprotease with PDZ domain
MRGMSGDLTGRLGRIRSLDLGGIVLEDVVAAFPDGGQMPHGDNGLNGNLGDDVLRRFDVVFDYAGKTMCLKPNDGFREPFEWDATGIVLSRDEPVDLKIQQVIPASPAAEAGLKVDDLLTSINGASASEYTHASLVKLFRRPGSELRLVARRGDERIEVTLTLRRLV